MITQGLHDLPFLGSGSLRRQLVSYWKMDEVLLSGGTRVDSRGTQNLSDAGTAVPYNVGSGILANVFAEFVPASSTRALQASSTPYLANASFTLSGWTRGDNTNNSVEISKWGAAQEYGFFQASPTTYPVMHWQAIEAGTLTQKILNVTQVTGGVWQYLTLGYDDNNKRIFAYVNAVSQGTTACNGVNTTSEPLTFGNIGEPVAALSQSGFQDWGFWRRVLSSAEITRLYNGGSGLAFNQF